MLIEKIKTARTASAKDPSVKRILTLLLGEVDRNRGLELKDSKGVLPVGDELLSWYLRDEVVSLALLKTLKSCKETVSLYPGTPVSADAARDASYLESTFVDYLPPPSLTESETLVVVQKLHAVHGSNIGAFMREAKAVPRLDLGLAKRLLATL